MAYGRITQKQSEILEYIKSQILNKGYPPSVRDICQAVNLKSTSSVHAHLKAGYRISYISMAGFFIWTKISLCLVL